MKNSTPGKKQTKHTPQFGNDKGVKSTSYKAMLWFLFIVSFFVYFNTLQNDYAYDDFSVIKENRVVTQGISAIPEILSTPYRWGYFHTSNDMYRPLSLVMFATEYEMFDGDPAIGHFMNVLLYTCCVVALFIFLIAVFSNQHLGVPFIATLLFALHPIHTEVVANIKSRDELLCFLFAITCLVSFIRYHAGGKLKYLLTGAILFFLSLLSKETSISLLAVIPVLFLLFKKENRQRSWLISACSILVAGGFLLVRYVVLKSHNASNISEVLFIDNFLVGAHSTLEQLATAILMMGLYLQKLFISYPLISDYSYRSIPFVGFDSVWVLLSLILYICLMIVCIVRSIRKRFDYITFGIMFFLVSIAIFSNLVFFTGAAMAERFLFFPSLGFCLVIAALLNNLFAKNSFITSIADIISNKKMLLTVGVISLIMMILTVKRNSEWKDNLTLFGADIDKSPDNARLNYYLGNEMFKAVNDGFYEQAQIPQMVAQAKHYLHHAVEIYPAYTDAYKSLAKGYFVTKIFDSSEYYYQKTLAIRPDDMEAWSDLDVVYYNSGRYQQSIETCKKILTIDKGMTSKYKNIGTCFMQLRQPDSAIYYWKQGAVSGEKEIYYRDIATAYRIIGNTDSAIHYETLAQ
jgi:protein O-mannosyl-transferase